LSFTAEIKGELCRLSTNPCCQKAELAALVLTNGNLQISRGGLHLNIVTEHAAIARRLYSLFKGVFGLSPRVLARKRARLKKNLTYMVQIPEPEQVRRIVGDLGIMTEGNLNTSISGELIRRRCCRQAYLRGCFLAGGAVSNPENSGYHLEMATEYPAQGEGIRRILAEMEIKSGLVRRKQQHVVYVKDSEQIADLLSLLGTSQARLNLENARIVKEIRNTVNRLVNCETANVNKTVEAAQRQVQAIRELAGSLGLEDLPPGLAQVARLRMEMPAATLEELGQAADPPLGKSAINYRLRRIIQLADELKEKSN
jgi:DNA-binding protein WhiA